MDVTPSWLPGEPAPDRPDLAELEALAARPLAERWAWLGDLEVWARDPHPDVRAAVLRCLAGCDGKVAEELLVAGLHDGHALVWRTALDVVAEAPSSSSHLWLHAATHPELEVRLAAVPSILARHQVLGVRMLADPEVRDAVIAATGLASMQRSAIDAALEHVAIGHLPTAPLARWTLSLAWSDPWSVLPHVHPIRNLSAPAGNPTPPLDTLRATIDHAAKHPDGLDALFAVWREDQGISATIAQAVGADTTFNAPLDLRLCIAILLAASRDPEIPASWVGLVARRWPAILAWETLPASTRRRAAAWLCPDPRRLPKPIPLGVLDPANLLAPPLDVDLLLTLLRIGTVDSLVTVAKWVDAATFAAVARARPECAAAILASPGASGDACIPVRRAWMKAVIDEGAGAEDLVGPLVFAGGDRAAEAVAVLPRNAIPDWLPHLDRLARAARAERVQHAIELLATRKPPPRFADLRTLLTAEEPGPVTQGLMGRLVGQQKLETLARLSRTELRRMAEWDAVAPLAPWEHLLALGALLPVELARSLGWLPPEPGHPLERDLPPPGRPRALTRKEARTLSAAGARELPACVAPFTTTSVTGLVEALGTRSRRSELSCVACLASRDPLADVALAVERLGLPSVLHAVDLRMVVLWSSRKDPSPAAALWLYRWDTALERFVAWAEGRPGGLAGVLEESLGWASVELRRRAWQAAIRHALAARWRRQPARADLDRMALRARSTLGELATELRLALGTEVRTHPPRPPTSAPTIPSVPVPVPAP
ncbi:MAG: hypothetical protein KC621_16585, partial [Myxococcales bacterium]|nr:hypothetical protein [Myxococcales bacterium]